MAANRDAKFGARVTWHAAVRVAARLRNRSEEMPSRRLCTLDGHGLLQLKVGIPTFTQLCSAAVIADYSLCFDSTVPVHLPIVPMFLFSKLGEAWAGHISHIFSHGTSQNQLTLSKTNVNI